jgi:hypothetical protein
LFIFQAHLVAACQPKRKKEKKKERKEKKERNIFLQNSLIKNVLYFLAIVG